MKYPLDQETLDKPRILCLHGGGSSAQIFYLQTRRLANSLAPYFRLVFADAPFYCEMHDDLKPFYKELGLDSCRRWSRWLPHQEATDNDTTIREIEESLVTAMDSDAGIGEWVGVLGFSQGAKMAMSILLENHFRREEDATMAGFAGEQFKFGVILAGRALPMALSERAMNHPYFDLPGEIPAMGVDTSRCLDRVKVPTLHVHGLKDAGLEMHRQLMRDFTEDGSAVLVEWNEGHRLPVKTVDVNAFTEGIMEVAQMARVL